jgi:molecular chaperone GrpE
MTKQNASQQHPGQQNGAGEAASVPHADVPADESIIVEATVSGGEELPEGASGSVVAEFDDLSGAPPAEATPEQMIAQLQAELDAEHARYATLHDNFQRAAAEFQNSRRRQEKQTAEAIDRASTRVIRKLIPVLDDLDNAFEHVPASAGDDQAAWVDGFRQIQRKLITLLEEEGVTQIPSVGAFDPTLHEAVSSEPNENVPSGDIIAALRAGYIQRGHVLRPALVRVSA